ncbi:MAG: hypothetical protein A2V77_05370 [Anaeromyxobacter sp. RBG_16_69_14]|nr:MAG: hypothetical protein A2V77_05370 [Anaeromyxobacter sp. RBG_16_69_14]
MEQHPTWRFNEQRHQRRQHRVLRDARRAEIDVSLANFGKYPEICINRRDPAASRKPSYRTSNALPASSRSK